MRINTLHPLSPFSKDTRQNHTHLTPLTNPLNHLRLTIHPPPRCFEAGPRTGIERSHLRGQCTCRMNSLVSSCLMNSKPKDNSHTDFLQPITSQTSGTTALPVQAAQDHNPQSPGEVQIESSCHQNLKNSQLHHQWNLNRDRSALCLTTAPNPLSPITLL